MDDEYEDVLEMFTYGSNIDNSGFQAGITELSKLLHLKDTPQSISPHTAHKSDYNSTESETFDSGDNSNYCSIPKEVFADLDEHMVFLDEGSFGVVYGYPKNNPTKAIKISKRVGKMVITKDKKEELQKEVEIYKKLMTLKHRNIVQYLGSFTSSYHKIYIVLEYMDDGSLYGYLTKVNKDCNKAIKSRLELYLIRHFTKQILEGLCYLHSKNIIHRDLRSSNILKTSKNILKLTDFGLSKDLDTITGSGTTLASRLNLVAYWQPPERLLAHENPKCDRLNKKYDIWMLGIVMLELTCVKPPHFSMGDFVYRGTILCSEDYLPEIPQFIDITIQSMIVKCLKRKIEDRPNVEILLKFQELEFLEQDKKVVLTTSLGNGTNKLVKILTTLGNWLTKDKSSDKMKYIFSMPGMIENLICLADDAHIDVIIALSQNELITYIMQHFFEKERHGVSDDTMAKILELCSRVLKRLVRSAIKSSYDKQKFDVFMIWKQLYTHGNNKIKGDIMSSLVNIMSYYRTKEDISKIVEHGIISVIVNDMTKCVLEDTVINMVHLLSDIAYNLGTYNYCQYMAEQNIDIALISVLSKWESSEDILVWVLSTVMALTHDAPLGATLEQRREIINNLTSNNIIYKCKQWYHKRYAIKLLSRISYYGTNKDHSEIMERGIISDIITDVAECSHVDKVENMLHLLCDIACNKGIYKYCQYMVEIKIVTALIDVLSKWESSDDIIVVTLSTLMMLTDNAPLGTTLEQRKDITNHLTSSNIITKCKLWYQKRHTIKFSSRALLSRISNYATEKDISEMVEQGIISDIITDITKCTELKSVQYMVHLLSNVSYDKGNYAHCKHMIELNTVDVLNEVLTKWDSSDDIVELSLSTIYNFLKPLTTSSAQAKKVTHQLTCNNMISKCKKLYPRSDSVKRYITDMLNNIAINSTEKYHSEMVEQGIISDILTDITNCTEIETVCNIVFLLYIIIANDDDKCTQYLLDLDVVTVLLDTVTTWDSSDILVADTVSIFNSILFTSSNLEQNIKQKIIQQLGRKDIVTRCKKWYLRCDPLKTYTIELVFCIIHFGTEKEFSDIVEQGIITDIVTDMTICTEEQTVVATMKLLLLISEDENYKRFNYLINLDTVTTLIYDVLPKWESDECIVELILATISNFLCYHEKYEKNASLFKQQQEIVNQLRSVDILTRLQEWYKTSNLNLKDAVTWLYCSISFYDRKREIISQFVEKGIISEVVTDITQNDNQICAIDAIILLEHVAEDEGRHKHCRYLVELGVVTALNKVLTNRTCSTYCVKLSLKTLSHLLTGTYGSTKKRITEEMDQKLIREYMYNSDNDVSKEAGKLLAASIFYLSLKSSN